jgi:hypothetical protein
MRAARGWVLAAGAIAAGCGHSNPAEPPDSNGNDASMTDAAGTDGAQGEAASGDAKAPEDANPGDASSSEASSPEAGAPDAPQGDAGLVDASTLPPECSPSFTWSKVTSVPSVAGANFGRFGSVSANELTVAWMSSTGAVFVADRASTSAPFGMPMQLDPGTVALAMGRVALTNSGQKLIATLAGGTAFVSFVRGGDAGTWTQEPTTEFININGMISEAGGAFAEPVVSVDGVSLFYVLTLGMNNPAVFESTWDSSTKTWTFGSQLPNPELATSSATELRRPTGASSDRRTLFFYDGTTAKERAAWRSSPTAPFGTFVDVTIAPEAAPAESCNTLYFQGTGGLFTASQ